LTEKSTVVLIGRPESGRNARRLGRYGAARSNPERAAPLACVGKRFSAVRLSGIDRLDAPLRMTNYTPRPLLYPCSRICWRKSDAQERRWLAALDLHFIRKLLKNPLSPARRSNFIEKLFYGSVCYRVPRKGPLRGLREETVVWLFESRS